MRAAAAVVVLVSAAAAAPARAPPSAAWVTISTEELRASFDVVWAVSDVHGRLEDLDQLLTAANLVERDSSGNVAWNRARRRQLLVVVGDSIDGGRESVGVVLRLDRLTQQAFSAGSRILVLLGNHEAAFLANPSTAERRLLSDAHRSRGELGLPRHPTGEHLADSEFGRFLRAMPVAAFVGSWLFAHSGYLDAKDDRAAVESYLAGLASDWSRPGNERYRALLDRESIVSAHNWWKRRSQRSRMRARLAMVGVDGLVFGHDPDALGFPDTIAMDPDGWLIKLDTGLKAGRSRGMLLRCDVARLTRGSTLAMIDGGNPICQSSTPTGALTNLSR